MSSLLKAPWPQVFTGAALAWTPCQATASRYWFVAGLVMQPRALSMAPNLVPPWVSAAPWMSLDHSQRSFWTTVSAVLVPGQGARRYVVPGEHVGARRYYAALADIQGRRRPHLSMPRGVAIATTVPVNLVQRWLPGHAHYPVDVEAIEVLVRDTRFDDTPARTGLGVEPVPFEQSLRDTLAWLVDAGRLSSRFAPREPAPA